MVDLTSCLTGQRSGIISAGIFAILLTFSTGCGRPDEVDTEERAVTVETKEVIQRDWQVVARAVGTLLADEQVRIRNDVAGFIRRIEADEGDVVNEGDSIVRIDDEKLALEVQKAKARYKEAKTTLSRRRPLFQRELITDAEIVEAETNYMFAEAELALARRRLEDTVVRAPMDGILGRRNVSRGDFAEVGVYMFDLVKMDVLKVDFDFSESYLSRLNVGQTIRVRTPAYPEKVFTGNVYFINPIIDPDTRTVELRARLDNEDMLLRPNLFVNVELDVVTVPDALVIPEEALIAGLGGYWVFIVDDDGIAQRRDVVLGEREPGWLHIREGLTADDIVVTTGHQRLFPGMRVRRETETGARRASQE